MKPELTRVRVHPTVFIASGAVVLGDVTLEARSSVWFNTVVRGDSAAVAIGEDTNLQDNTVVHEDEGFPALVGARVTVGHRSIIHGCVIEDDCLIGMGSVILSGARIGAGSLIGAASLVREGQEIPPGSLAVGSPARVLGPVNEAHRESIRNGFTHYAALASFYRERGVGRDAEPRGAVTIDARPMSEREWSDLVRILAEAPNWVDARRHGQDPLVLALLLAELSVLDRRYRWPLVEAMIRGEHPAFEEPVQVERETDFESWRGFRARLCRRLEALGPEHWGLLARLGNRGALSIGELVREWVETELARRRAFATLVGPER